MTVDLGQVAVAASRFAEIARDGISTLAYAERERGEAARIAAESEAERESAEAIEEIAGATARAHVANWNAKERARVSETLAELLALSIQVACAALLELARRTVGKYRGEPSAWPEGRHIDGISLRDIVWAGRNQATHSDEGTYRPEVLATFARLESSFGAGFHVRKGLRISRAREVVELLGWLDPKQFVSDVQSLLS